MNDAIETKMKRIVNNMLINTIKCITMNNSISKNKIYIKSYKMKLMMTITHNSKSLTTN